MGPVGVPFDSIQPALQDERRAGGGYDPDGTVKVFTVGMDPKDGSINGNGNGNGNEIRYFFCKGEVAPQVHVERSGKGGEIRLYVHFNNVCTFRLLSGEEVCRILQVSRSFLKRLAARGDLRSYKIGRLRRFLLEDVLEYLGSRGIFSAGNSRSGKPQ